MSEIMRPMPFEQLMTWAVEEYRCEGRIFGVHKNKFYRNMSGSQMEIFGERLSSPVGPAAGPNSQLAQNIIAAYLAGSRFIELKTVQKMDGAELSACVARPCINAEDEGYNVEWSTELTVPQAYEEYVKAWLAIHVLSKSLDISPVKDFAFNMSVGYDLEGIKSPKVNSYIEGMTNATGKEVFENGKTWLKDNIKLFPRVNKDDVDSISANVSRSITLSTLHGCPPDEIERIAKYLLDEKKVHTFVKCNPTLLGYEKARKLLDEMGYNYIQFDDHHFKGDLQYGDALAMLKRLMAYAEERKLSFGVKITNTFPVQIARNELPGEEMYMSGRALLPLSINVANKLSQDFNGKLPISYSGGADAMNINDIYSAGIRPITIATTILKPGGYERIKQICESLELLMEPQWRGVDCAYLEKLIKNLPQRSFYRKEHRPVASRKTKVPLELFDCFQAPCKNGGCPIEQQIPEYLSLVSEGKFDEAFKVITIDNAAPGITGTICNHVCQSHCTRLDYDTSVQIRNAKKIAAQSAQSEFIAELRPSSIKSDKKIAVVGAGPGGIAAALYLRRNGMSVTVYEKRAEPFGIVNYVIPSFRVSRDTIYRDYEMAVKTGVEFKFNTPVDDVLTLKKEYDYVIVAVGAWKEGMRPFNDENENALDALAFLEKSKQMDCQLELGQSVAVIGGGNVAMDCARAARRAKGVNNVTVVYRRTKEFMPADHEEIEFVIDEGINITELHAPKGYKEKTLICEIMELGDYDSSGRRSFSGTGKEVSLEFDTVICAVGARVEDCLYKQMQLETEKSGLPVVSSARESSIDGIYIVGDCKAGPKTVVEAMADAKASCIDILDKENLVHDFVKYQQEVDLYTLYQKKGLLENATLDYKDASRCLSCDKLCELCCDVCPNRANVRILADGFENHAQILHIDGMCNECGNCGIFCPHSGNPYKDKFTLFWSREDFIDSENKGFLPLDDGSYMLRLEDEEVITAPLHDERIPRKMASIIEKVVNQYPYYMPQAQEN